MEQHALVIKHTTISDVLNLYMIFKKDRITNFIKICKNKCIMNSYI